MATEPANLRKSFEGLSNEVRHVLAADPLSGHVFLFLNRRRTMVKMLLWTRGGNSQALSGRRTTRWDAVIVAPYVPVSAREPEGLLLPNRQGRPAWPPAVV